ncbi:MAG: hypothetical protein U1B80_06975, partial [Anaerolineaceae bacterium]|nr:hypothetical protein [Anaerolineaceae bacterium]
MSALIMRFFRRSLHWVSAATVAVYLLAGVSAIAAAQPSAGAVIQPPLIAQFPTISFLLEAFDNEGKFITDLMPDQVRVLENNKAVEVKFLERQEPGLQVIVAMNVAPIFANTVAGVSHFQQIRLALLAWMQSRPPAEGDDFSLASNTGLEAIRLTRPEEWLKAVSVYNPPLLQSQVSIVSLAQALELATATNPRPDMKRVILYITASPTTPVQAALPNLASRAEQLGMQVFVWMVAPVGQANTPAAQSLRVLAETTGGEFFLFSGAEALPDPETYFESLRYHYRVTYTSAINKSGSHRVAAEVVRSDLRIVSNQELFSLVILPPKPIFLAPPARIERVWSPAPNRRDPSRLEPANRMIQMLVEFPDGYPRALKSARLYVDGVLAVENTRE